MSYPPPRPGASPLTAPTPLQNDSHPTPPTQTAPSPLDWSSFMNFQTPPVLPTGSGSNSMPPPTSTYGVTRPQSAGGTDLYGFAQGAHVNQANRQGNMSFQQPPSFSGSAQSTGSSSGGTSQNYPPSPASQGPPGAPMARPGDGKGNGKAKSVNPPPSPAPGFRRQTSGSFNQVGGGGDGLSLDPAAFSRDIRFQMPSFLSNPVGGAPTFPPGGEAWTGFSNPGDANGGVLTPGQLFSNMFNPPDASGGYGNGLGGDGTWTSGGGWDAKDQAGGGGGYAGSTTFYVNPNPSPSNYNTNRQNQPQGNYPPRPSESPRTSGPGLPPFGSTQQSAQTASAPNPSHPTMTSAFNSFVPHPHDNAAPAMASSNSMPTAALLGGMDGASYNTTAAYPFVSSLSETVTNSASTVNIASSSTAPYAPPSNTAQLLTAPVAPPIMGPSPIDGPGLYSTTGFDMVGVLSRVAARKDPKTVLGPVDLSCSFAVVDVRRFDCPIVYASPTFTALTGYELPQILGRNCRFLQSPDGEVVKGSKRKYTDNVAVAHLKRMLNAGKECQASLINYRRGGIPFINLITVVPIPWEGTDIVYHVGFQVDLVEQPNAILRNMKDGSYQVNYTVANPPQPPLRPAAREPGTSGLSADVLDIMGQRVNAVAFGQGEDGAKMDWLKMVLENSDDFVHVLSLKGSFQYASPSVRRVLEYEPEDLINKNISDICHPSDIVPLMRELKDSTHAPSEGAAARRINLVFRIRHKNSGYVWIECAGRLHVEAGKGRKAVILSGRARSVHIVPWDSISRHGGLAEKEFWAKISFQGLILHTTSTVTEVLGQRSEDIVGQSFYSLLPGGDNGPPPSATDPTSPVSVVANAFRSATRSSTKDGGIMITHKLAKRSGELVDVITVLYTPKTRPDLEHRESDGNMTESPSSDESGASSQSAAPSSSNLRPTFLVAQIKLLSGSNLPNNLLPSSSTSTNPVAVANLTNARPIAHAGSSNLFEELETTRGTSWQYELHQLRLLNRRLKDDVLAARVVAKNNAARGRGRKRKAGDEMGPPAVPGLSLNQRHGQVLGGTGMEQYQQYGAAPRHQMAPGFGLINPNIQSPYF